MTTQHLEIFADYSQFYLCDPEHLEDWSADWTDLTMANRLIAMTTTVVFGTDRNFTVPVDVELGQQRPDVDALAASADHAVTASICCRSGSLKVAGCTDYLPNAFSMPAAPGHYGVLYRASQLATVSGLDGDDHYSVHLWPLAGPAPVEVLRRHPLP